MVTCKNKECKNKYFHYRCVGLSKDHLTDDQWQCDQCQEDSEETVVSAVKNLQLCMGTVMEQMNVMQQQLARNESTHAPSTGTRSAPPTAPHQSQIPPLQFTDIYGPRRVTTVPHQNLDLLTPPEHPSASLYSTRPAAHPNDDVIVGTAIIPRDSVDKATKGLYVDFSNLLNFPSATREERVTLRDGQLRISGKVPSRPISSFHLWLKAWGNYEEILLSYHPLSHALYPELAAYRRIIQEAQEIHTWRAVYAYDTSFRLDLARRNSLQFSTIDTRIYIANLNAKTLRQDTIQCFRCQSTGHAVRDCPFPEGQQGQMAQKKKEICNNFNDKVCTFPGCTRQHVCRRCHGPQPASKCDCK